MRMLRRFLGLALIGLTAISLVAGESASADTGGDEMDLAARINGLRVAKGLAPLAVKGELFDLARAWSGKMAGAGALSHNPLLSTQAPPNWTRLADNVGTGIDVGGLFDAFVNSPVHYTNMVDPAFNTLGVGAVRDGAGQLFVTMTFMNAGPPPPAVVRRVMVRKVVRVCSKSRRGRTVCVRRARMVQA